MKLSLTSLSTSLSYKCNENNIVCFIRLHPVL